MASQDETSLGKAGILSLNKLSYRMDPDLSVAVSRTVTSQWFVNQQAAAGSSSMCLLNTGSSYVNLKQSSLVFDLTNNSTCPVWFGKHGSSAASVINRLVISSRSGQVLEKVLKTYNIRYIKKQKHKCRWTGATSYRLLRPCINMTRHGLTLLVVLWA
jgi:hypothetical protein